MSLLDRWSLLPALLLAAVACNGADFAEQPACHGECPFPPSAPPSVRWISPAPGDTLFPSTILFVGASDDREVDHVTLEYFQGLDWRPITPSPLQAPPYSVEFGRYIDTTAAMGLSFIELRAIAVDIEGNADTATLTLPTPR